VISSRVQRGLRAKSAANRSRGVRGSCESGKAETQVSSPAARQRGGARARRGRAALLHQRLPTQQLQRRLHSLGQRGPPGSHELVAAPPFGGGQQRLRARAAERGRVHGPEAVVGRAGATRLLEEFPDSEPVFLDEPEKFPDGWEANHRVLQHLAGHRV
jgi:hypothetical protein